jgi:hypothetical protein
VALSGDPLPPGEAGGLPAPPDVPPGTPLALGAVLGLEPELGLDPTSAHEASSTIALPGSALPPTPDRSVKKCGQGIRGVVQITLDPATW